MNNFASRLSTLVIEIILTICICLVIGVNVLTDLMDEAHQYGEHVAFHYQAITDGYLSSFKALAGQVREEINSRDPSVEELDRWLKAHESQFRYAVGPAVYDGFYASYKGSSVRSWSYGDYSKYDATKRPWYLEAEKAKGQAVLVAPYNSYLADSNQESPNPINLTIAQRYTNSITFAMDLRISDINALLLVEHPDYPGALSLLLDRQGNIVSANDRRYYSHNIHRADSVIHEDLRQCILQEGNQGEDYCFRSIDGGYMLAYIAPAENGNTFCLIVPLQDIFAKHFLAVIIIAVLLIVIEIVVFYVNRRRIRSYSKREQHYLLILRSLAVHYDWVFLGNMNTKTYEILRFGQSPMDSAEKWDPATAVMSIREPYRQAFLDAVAFSDIAERLGRDDAYDITIQGQSGHWYMVKVLSGLAYESTGEFFVCLENADKQMAYQQKLETALEQANVAARAKSDFLSRMSHDIRTPLNGIMGMTSIAQDLNKADDVSRCLATIQTSGQFLLGLINDILDVVKIESGKFELNEKPTSVQQFSDMIDAVIWPLMKAKDIHFQYKLGVKSGYARVDLRRLGQIFFNLLSNASKYTPQGGSVLFSVESMGFEGPKEWIRFIVKDNGIGMKEEFLKRVFEPFEQEDGSNDSLQWKGTGLGLPIAKELTEKMGGRITVESRKGQGTTFCVEIPILPCEPFEASHENLIVSTNGLVGKTVLVAEDNEINTVVVQTMLESKGMHVLTVTNGKEAVEMYSRHADEIDAILMDVMMPVMDGVGATRAIRALPLKKATTVPIIAVTANAFADDIDNCLAAGMNAHLSKPIEPRELYKVIGEYVGS